MALNGAGCAGFAEEKSRADGYAGQVTINAAQLAIAAGDLAEARAVLERGAANCIRRSVDYCPEALASFVCLLSEDCRAALLPVFRGGSFRK